MKTLMLALFSLIAVALSFEEDCQEMIEDNDLRFARHGFVILPHRSDSNKVFVSHLPMYSSPHDYQFIFEAQIDKITDFEFEHYYEAVTSNISLSKLVNLTDNQLSLDIYDGFSRDKNIKVSNATLTIINIIYSKQLNPSDPSEVNSQKYIIYGGHNNTFYLSHLIQGNPNFYYVVSGYLNSKSSFEKNNNIVFDVDNIETKRINNYNTFKGLIINDAGIQEEVEIKDIFSFSCRSGPQIYAQCQAINITISSNNLNFLENQL